MREARMPMTPWCQPGRRARCRALVVGVQIRAGQRLFLHAGLDFAAFAVERVELLRDVERAAGRR
jgi:hypothetical protein